MGKQLIVFIFFVILSTTADASVKYKLNYSRIKPGETVNYVANWGILTIGNASVSVDSRIFKINSVPCYKIDVQGKTNGIAKLFYVKDSWTSYVDTATIQTHKSSRSIREGSYQLDEQIDFDHLKNKATVKVYNKKTKVFEIKKIFDTPEKIRDVIAGFLVVRMIDFVNLKAGETFTINGFYEDEGYKIDVVYKGIETIKLRNKTYKCYKINPVMPKNKVFDGKNAVDVWLSCDEKQNIVRIKARMFVGSIIIDQTK